MRKITRYSIQNIYREDREDRGFWKWGQLNYSYNTTSMWGPARVFSFRTIVWFPGDWHAYKMWPYLCYSGDKQPRYRRLSAKITLGIYAILVRTKIRHFIRWSVPQFFIHCKNTLTSTARNILSSIKNHFSKHEDIFKDLYIN